MKTSPMIGFISAPAWYDPAPSEFPQVVEEEVRTQQAPLLLPEFDYHLKSFARIQGDLNLCARSLSALGCDLVVQVGSPFAWAGVTSEAEARERNRAMEKASGVPAVMTGLAIVDGLRAIGANKVAVTCTYYEPEWRDAFRAFLRMCGFEVLHASTLAEQALADSSAKMKDYGWSMTSEIAGRSILAVADAAPDAEAIVVTGSGTRTLSILCDMESQTGRPLVAADTIVYWAAARELELTIKPVMGSLAKSARALVKD